MRKPVESFQLYCDGCGDQFEAEDYGFFTAEWPFDEYGWVCYGGIDLCEDCTWRLENLVRQLVEGTDD